MNAFMLYNTLFSYANVCFFMGYNKGIMAWTGLILRTSHRKCSVKKGVLKTFAIFTGKHLCWSLFLIKLQPWRPATLLKRDSNTDVFVWIVRDFWEHLLLLLLNIEVNRFPVTIFSFIIYWQLTKAACSSISRWNRCSCVFLRMIKTKPTIPYLDLFMSGLPHTFVL